MRLVTTNIDSGWQVAERVGPGVDSDLPNGGERGWIPAAVPGHVHLDLLNAGIIADPFFRMQERSCQWVDHADWSYRTTFQVDAERLAASGPGGRHFLKFNGLDTIARVFLNGALIGTSENFFVPVRFDVTDTLNGGDNDLRVEFDSALRVGQALATSYLGDGTSERGSQSYFNFGPRAFVRKAQYMFGWDWGPELVSCGIWQSVELITVPVAEITDWRCDYRFLAEGLVDIDILLTVKKYDDQPLTVGASLFAAGDTTPSMVLEGPPGEYSVPLQIFRFRCIRWSPNGSGGSQRRYLLNLKIQPIVDEDEDAPIIHLKGVSLGFRTVALVREPDADGNGEGFRFHINGVDTVIKGANWIPDSSFPAAITPKQLRERLTQARDAGFNMLRVWGGGLYESETFYDLCDELGLLVWQDFSFACSMYPDDLPEFCEAIRLEAVTAVRRIRHRASLALWCGGNENLELAQDRWAGDTQAKRFFGEHIIDDILPAVLSAEDTRTPYWPNSPYGGPRASSEDFGDSHYWNVWHAKTPESNGDWTNYVRSRSRFSSEFGFAAPAGATAWDGCMLPEDRSVRSLVSQFHDKTRKGYEKYLGYIERHYPESVTWDDLLYYGQLNQADALRFGVEHWRREKARCGGTLFWQLNDCYPTHSWAVVDSAGEPKAAYYASKRFYQPVLLSLVANGSTVAVHLVNDLLTTVDGQLALRIVTFDGREVATSAKDIAVAANAASGQLLSLDLPSDVSPNQLFAHATLTGVDGVVMAKSTSLLAEPKDLELPDPEVSIVATVDGDGRASFQLSAPSFAGSVRLGFAGVERQPTFSDNYFPLIPGTTKTIRVAGVPAQWDTDALRSRLQIRHLGSVTAD